MPKYQVVTTHTFREREIHTPVHDSVTHVTQSSMWSVCHICMFKFTFMFGCKLHWMELILSFQISINCLFQAKISSIHTTGHVCDLEWTFISLKYKNFMDILKRKLIAASLIRHANIRHNYMTHSCHVQDLVICIDGSRVWRNVICIFVYKYAAIWHFGSKIMSTNLLC